MGPATSIPRDPPPVNDRLRTCVRCRRASPNVVTVPYWIGGRGVTYHPECDGATGGCGGNCWLCEQPITAHDEYGACPPDEVRA